MALLTVIQLLFLLIALAMIVWCFFPAWNFNSGPVVAIGRIVGTIIGLIVLYILYIIVVAIFTGAPVLP